MANGKWRGSGAPWIAVAFGLLIIGFAAWTLAYTKGYQRAHRDHEADYAAHYAAQRNYEECLAQSTVKEAVECTKAVDTAYRENVRSDQGLNAQREMADWAERMFWATVLIGFITTAITGLGVVYVRRTIVETRQIADRQLRPYLYFVEGHVSIWLRDNLVNVSSRVVFVNGGVTPATVRRHAIMTHAMPKGLFRDRIGGGVATGTKQVVGNGRPFEVGNHFSAPQERLKSPETFDGSIVVGVILDYEGTDVPEETWLMANVSEITSDQASFPLRQVDRPEALASMTEHLELAIS